MNQVLENMLTRRSTRDFSDKAVAKQDIETLIEAARYAPSGMNRQTWHFTAVLNQELKAELYNLIAELLGRDNYTFYNATALIIPTNQRDSAWGRDDNACALQNIFLAAHSIGIDSVWINQLNDLCDHPKMRALLTKLGIPEDHVCYGLAALGYSKSAPAGKVEKAGSFTIVE